MIKKFFTLILLILLAISLTYIAVDKYQESKQQQLLTAYQQGIQLGYEQAIIQLVQQASTCQPVPIYIQNQSISLVAVACLKQPD
ncbi:MAG TPA: hypothetical protein VJH95_02475 [Candidatus Nanoarchaeia archaeon]|nr:hypothetical protein [Candidatus Nanoarchaeia archaeon]